MFSLVARSHGCPGRRRRRPRRQDGELVVFGYLRAAPGQRLPLYSGSPAVRQQKGGGSSRTTGLGQDDGMLVVHGTRAFRDRVPGLAAAPEDVSTTLLGPW